MILNIMIRVSGTDPDGHNCYLSPEEVAAISFDNLEYSSGWLLIGEGDVLIIFKTIFKTLNTALGGYW